MRTSAVIVELKTPSWRHARVVEVLLPAVHEAVRGDRIELPQLQPQLTQDSRIAIVYASIALRDADPRNRLHRTRLPHHFAHPLMDQIVTLSPLWDRVWARRRAILTLAATATILTGIIAFLLPPWYRAEVELLPPGEEETGISLASLVRGVALPGIKLPTQVTPADVFLVVLQSRRIGEQMAKQFDLKKLYRKKYMVDALKELRQHVHFKLTEAGTVQISVEDRSRQRAANMANAYVNFLDEFNRQARMSKGRRTRLFIEARLIETKQELEASERRLAEYQARNKAVVLSPQMSSAIEQAASLYGRRTALHLRRGVIRSYSHGSEEELQIEQELAQIDRQLSALPETGLELGRLVREVRALEQVFAFLTAQYEDARITEARDIVTIDVLDTATPPERKSRPKRLTMMLGALFLSLALGAGLAMLQEEHRPRSLVRAVAAD